MRDRLTLRPKCRQTIARHAAPQSISSICCTCGKRRMRAAVSGTGRPRRRTVRRLCRPRDPGRPCPGRWRSAGSCSVAKSSGTRASVSDLVLREPLLQQPSELRKLRLRGRARPRAAAPAAAPGSRPPPRPRAASRSGWTAHRRNRPRDRTPGSVRGRLSLDEHADLARFDDEHRARRIAFADDRLPLGNLDHRSASRPGPASARAGSRPKLLNS